MTRFKIIRSERPKNIECRIPLPEWDAADTSWSHRQLAEKYCGEGYQFINPFYKWGLGTKHPYVVVEAAYLPNR